MSVDWGSAGGPRHTAAEERQPVTDASEAWAALAESFPDWTLEPPLMLAPRPRSA
jgi:hypothetical protein